MTTPTQAPQAHATQPAGHAADAHAAGALPEPLAAQCQPRPAPLIEPALRLAAPPADLVPLHSPAQKLRRAIDAAVESLLRKQRTTPFAGRGKPGHHWCGELEGDSILSSEYILMKWILGQESTPEDRRRLPRIANQLRLSQRADGTWGQYPGAPMDISATVKGYVALKLMGDGADEPHMARARGAILRAGGAERCNTFSTFYLACLGIVDWDACPAIPPQIVLLPRWFPFHLRKVAAWTRTMILPLALCSALRPVRRLPPGVHADELFVDARAKRRLNKRLSARRPLSWHNAFLLIDRGLKLARRAGLTPLRARSVRAAERWIAQRMDPATTEGLGAIFPPMVYLQVAFQRLGYTRDHPLIRQAEADLDAFMIDQPDPDPRLDHIRLQPCFSPVWDTAIALDALTDAGLRASTDQRVALACDWLRDNEVTRVGDWHDNLRPADRGLRPGVDTACWAFEYRNDWYPDVDDTAMVAKALHKAGDRPGQTLNRDAAARAVRWVLAMQNDDGGWAAFDRTKDRRWMEAIPFADHNAMQDPSCSDITGRVMDALLAAGLSPAHEAIARGVRYLLRTQRPQGCWWGRWGVNFIYGTWQAVNGLTAAGLPRDHPALARARRWLGSMQNPDGGFGETANSYLDESLMGRGPSTASQTAWGLITLLNLLPPAPTTTTGAAPTGASPPGSDPAIARAAQWLMDHQLAQDKPSFSPERTRDPAVAVAGASPDGHINPGLDPIADLAGGWNEHWFSGTGFPKVFYLRYHLYRHSFPLKALAKYREAMSLFL
ncbi:MAG: squalene--hopene cyclase [Isosphaera sp.]|nr:squalene--hopene cyclase [Isosphaera sp.]